MLKKKYTKLDNRKANFVSHIFPHSTVSEQYRTIRTNIEFAMTDKKLTSLGITSSISGEGKTTTAINMGIIFANTGKQVLLVDGDLRKKSVTHLFNYGNKTGLSNLLAQPKLAINDSLKQTKIDNLYLIPSGGTSQKPSELLGSKVMDQRLNEMMHQFDLVIIDLPPVVSVTDGQIVSAKVDGTILVVREGVSEKAKVMKAKRLLAMGNSNVIGAIYNDASLDMDSQDYAYLSMIDR